eukprot:scaffold368_cov258-Pinguiococcus_pyrenoidosus.AAC.47
MDSKRCSEASLFPRGPLAELLLKRFNPRCQHADEALQRRNPPLQQALRVRISPSVSGGRTLAGQAARLWAESLGQAQREWDFAVGGDVPQPREIIRISEGRRRRCAFCAVCRTPCALQHVPHCRVAHPLVPTPSVHRRDGKILRAGKTEACQLRSVRHDLVSRGRPVVGHVEQRAGLRPLHGCLDHRHNVCYVHAADEGGVVDDALAQVVGVLADGVEGAAPGTIDAGEAEDVHRRARLLPKAAPLPLGCEPSSGAREVGLGGGALIHPGAAVVAVDARGGQVAEPSQGPVVMQALNLLVQVQQDGVDAVHQGRHGAQHMRAGVERVQRVLRQALPVEEEALHALLRHGL